MKTSQPLYCQLMERFQEKILSGEWPLDSMIPSERVLSERFNVSRITVRGAIEELVKLGMLKKVQGKGTFVINRTILQNLEGMYSFTSEMKKHNRFVSADIIRKEVIQPSLEVASILNLGAAEAVVYLERLRYDENLKPIILEKSYFPHGTFGFLMDEELEGLSLYELLELKHGIVFDKAVERFKLCLLNREESQLLGVRRSEACYGMLVRRVSYIGDRVASYSSLVTNGDIMEFTITLGGR